MANKAEKQYQTVRERLLKLGESPSFGNLTLKTNEGTEVIKGEAPKERTQSEIERDFKREMKRLIDKSRLEKKELVKENANLREGLENMRSALRVAAERMGGQFIALESEVSANEDGVVVTQDDKGNIIVTVIPEWVRTSDEEVADEDDDGVDAFTFYDGSTATASGQLYQGFIQGTYTSSGTFSWDQPVTVKLSDNSPTTKVVTVNDLDDRPSLPSTIQSYPHKLAHQQPGNQLMACGWCKGFIHEELMGGMSRYVHDDEPVTRHEVLPFRVGR
jgi:predicted DNA-binding ribbon-helix-helix protein